MYYATHVAINAPAGRVWSILSDVESWPQWAPSVSSVERLDDAPFGVGSQARMHKPRLPEMDWRITKVNDGRSFEWQTRRRGLQTVAGHYIEVAGSDRSTLWLTVEQTGPLAQLARLWGGRTRKHIAMEAQGVRRLAEAQARGEAAPLPATERESAPPAGRLAAAF